MKRIAIACAALAAGVITTLSVAPMSAATAATAATWHAAQAGPAVQRGPYASARGGAPASVNAPGDTKAGQKEPPPSIPYDADGPAYMPGQTRSTDFQLQH
jgi:hypothetical protein